MKFKQVLLKNSAILSYEVFIIPFALYLECIGSRYGD